MHSTCGNPWREAIDHAASATWTYKNSAIRALLRAAHLVSAC